MNLTIERFFDYGKLDTLSLVTNIYTDPGYDPAQPADLTIWKTGEVRSRNNWIKKPS